MSGSNTGCPVSMTLPSIGIRCGREIHHAPHGADEQNVCLMHSQDPRKQAGPLFNQFWANFEEILRAAGHGDANFTRFVFPEVDLRTREIQSICCFAGATFTQNFRFRATFKRHADFSHATFKQDASFYEAVFEQNASFFKATFEQNANFSCATFIRATEGPAVRSSGAEKADFRGAVFAQDADFSATTFTTSQRLKSNADSVDSSGQQTVDFSEAIWKGEANFSGTTFQALADWRKSRFLDRVKFLSTGFEPEGKSAPSAVFDLAEFSQPGAVVFNEVDLSRVLFQNCDVSQLWFASSVKWAERPGGRGLAVFDETVPLNHQGLQGNGRRDFKAVAQIYHQLKKNFDSRLDYWTANDFHFGEMEMKRLAGQDAGCLLPLRRWLHRNLSTVAFYRLTSDYGNSYRKPAAMLLATLALFAVLLPLPGIGLKRQSANLPETYTTTWDTRDGWAPNLNREVRLEAKAAVAAVEAATYQRNSEYSPAYPWGRVLAIVTTLLTSTLFGLFLLAVRRQFKR